MAHAKVGGDVEVSESQPSSDYSQNTKILMLGALGVVYGDIGTSPIYAFRETLHAPSGGAVVTRTDVLGLLSLIVWALTLIVTIKYVVFVLRADNKGEGGTLSLMALARASNPNWSKAILRIGVIGAALFFGDAIITPAISVLSAVEGLKVATPAFDPFVVPITLVVLAALFSVQRFGTGKVANVFGPITGVWFLAIGAFGMAHIADDPTVLFAVNPYYAIVYLASQPEVAFVTIGAVSMPTSAISDGGRSCSPGSPSSFQACCSVISGRARSCLRMAARRRTRSSRCCRPGD
ncbi:MAG: hypothetical protein EOR92_29685 [Mesorhizobium sp.]|nr:MAG: hypothetical protein EOR92_29685 [Mesorhizobium sp.]